MIKLGGSFITDKTIPRSFQKAMMQQMAAEIKNLTECNPELRILVGNGAGSYGHFVASQHAIRKTDNVGKAYGFCMVQQSVRQLNSLVVDSMLEAGLSALSVTPSSMIIASGGSATKLFAEPITGLLDSKIVPVVYGDIVYDKTGLATIISTEKLFALLLDKLRSDYVSISIIYVGKEDGVLDSSGKVIDVITIENHEIIKKELFQTEGFDVTGGMRMKLDESIKIAATAKDVYIIGGKKGNLTKAVMGKKIGTRITSSQKT